MIDYNRLYQHLNLKDKKDPRSIVNLVPSWFAKHLEVIPDEVFSLTEDELRKRCNPFPREEKLRISFWQEYYRISNSKRPQQINISNVCGGICDHRTFQALIKNSFMLAFILMAPPEINTSLEEIVLLGMKRMRDIMVMAPVDSEGKFDKNIADMQFKIYQDSLNRRRGPISATTKNLHVHKHDMQAIQPPTPTMVEAIPSNALDIESQIEQEEQLLIEDTPVEIKEAIHEVLANEPQEV